MQIEKGVPVPPPKRGIGTGRPASELTKLVRKMKRGECVLVDSPEKMRLARVCIYEMGGKPLSRKMVDGWRVWRVE